MGWLVSAWHTRFHFYLSRPKPSKQLRTHQTCWSLLMSKKGIWMKNASRDKRAFISMNHSIFSKSGDWLAAAANPHAARRQRLFWPRVASHAVLKTNPLNCHSFIFLWNFRHNNLWDHLSYQRIHMLEQWTWIDVRISEQNSRSYTQIQSQSCLRQHLHHFFSSFLQVWRGEKWRRFYPHFFKLGL